MMLARNLWNTKLQITSAVRNQTSRRKYSTSSGADEIYYPKHKNIHLPGGLDQYKKLYAESISDPAGFWGKVTNNCFNKSANYQLAKGLDWEKPFTDVMHGYGRAHSVN